MLVGEKIFYIWLDNAYRVVRECLTNEINPSSNNNNSKK